MVAVALNAAEPASPKMAQTASFTLCAAAAAKSLQSCPTLCNPIDGSPPGSPVPGILQARTLEWGAFPSPMHESECEVAQSCPTPSDPLDCSPPGSSVHGVFQARVLEWGAIAFSYVSFTSIKTKGTEQNISPAPLNERLSSSMDLNSLKQRNKNPFKTEEG